jgi:hypothetical protein
MDMTLKLKISGETGSSWIDKKGVVLTNSPFLFNFPTRKLDPAYDKPFN